jgi:transposase
MCLKAQAIPHIPEQTKQVAEAAFPKGNRCLRIREVFDGIFKDDEFTAYYPPQGQPAYSPWRQALVSMMQYMENLTDRQAADMVRARIDWKYVLSLELTDKGFDASILSEFRQRLIDHQAESQLFDRLLEVLNEHGLLKSRGKQRTDSTAIWASVKNLNRLEHIGETVRYALDELAREAPELLSSLIEPEWLERYGKRIEEYRLPKGKESREALAIQIGHDGLKLLSAIDEQSDADQLDAIQILRRTWQEQYEWQNDVFRWRAKAERPPSGERLHSPYDPEASYTYKNGNGWLGYKVHFTETCEDDVPHVIVHVETTTATVNDRQVIRFIHQALEQRGLLPTQQIVDCGYMQMDDVVYLGDVYDVELLGPLQPDSSWQAKAKQGYSNLEFKIDWERKITTCPQGQTTSSWSEMIEDGHPSIHIRFPKVACLACSARSLCTKSATEPRTIHLLVHHEQLQELRRQQQTDEWHDQYADRAGIEATFSQATRITRLRKTPYRGTRKTHLHNLLSAMALNIIRVDDWLIEKPKRLKRITAFQRFAEPLAS